jgi:hypothetical protein
VVFLTPRYMKGERPLIVASLCGDGGHRLQAAKQIIESGECGAFDGYV